MTLWEDAVIVLTLILLEAVLSFDNAAILAAMVRKLPMKDRRKALLYGLAGAYALRTSAILLASFLIQNPILKVLGGGYLLFLGLKHLWGIMRSKEEGREEAKPIEKGSGIFAALGIPLLVGVIIQIEFVDLAFAVDQVVVAVAFTDHVVLIVIASMVGILFLRLAAAVIARVMDWLPLLEDMAYAAVGFVGARLVFSHPVFAPGGTCIVPPMTHLSPSGESVCEVPTPVSIAITLSLFLVPIALKLLLGIPRSSPGSHEAASMPEDVRGPAPDHKH